MDKSVFEKFGQDIAEQLNDIVFANIYDSIQNNQTLRKTINPAFPYPKLLRIGILQNCLAIEYIGPEDKNNDILNAECSYNPNYGVYDFLNIDLKHCTASFQMPCSGIIDNTAIFIGDSITYLCDYFYDFNQMPMEMFTMNTYYDFSNIQEPIFISNTTFFWTDINGTLKIKHIDFMEIFPITEEGIPYRSPEGMEQLSDFLLNYEVPNYKIELHKILNDFIELINLADTTEPRITKFLEENPEIIQMTFGAHKLNGQVTLEWQYPTTKTNLKPDFMPEKMDGYCDILEFKLPRLKHSPMVGKEERYHPSNEVDAAIAQIDCYEEWCTQEINIRWLEKEKGIKVSFPQRTLIIGHSEEFSAEDRRRLRGIRQTTVLTYDEFIELARFQLYRFR